MTLSTVYVLSNPAMPGIVKIGMTSDDVSLRLSQLYQTGVPFPFELQFACRVSNAAEVEMALHKAFYPNRINPKREFFKIDADQAIAVLKLLHVEEVTSQVNSETSPISNEEKEAARRYKSRRPILNFKEMGIPVGSKLQFTDGNVEIEVVSDRKVRFSGQEMYISAVTGQIMGSDKSFQLGRKWTYNGRYLGDIYEETYLE